MTHVRRILEDKQKLREQSAAKPFSEKLRILEKMRDRDRTIRSGRTSALVKAKNMKKK